MALPEPNRSGIDSVGYGDRDFTQEAKAIGGQMARFEELRTTSAVQLSQSVQAAMKQSLSYQDRVKFDIGRMGDQNLRILNDVLQEQVRKNTAVTSDSAKFLQDRTIFLTKRLLEADASEAKAIAGELKDIRKSARGLADTERQSIEELAKVGSQGLGQVSLIREAFQKSLPKASDLVEGALGGGFVGKLAGNVMRVRQERKQRKASLAGELEARRDFGPQAPLDMQPTDGAGAGAAGAQGVFPFMNETEDTLGKIAENTKDSARALEKSLKGNVEEKKEEGRRDERLLDALENIDGGDNVTIEEPGKKEGGIMGIISGVMGGLSILGTGLRLIKNPKLAFRFFRMKLFKNVLGPLKNGLGAIFGKGGMLRGLISGLGGFLKSTMSGVGSFFSSVSSFVSKGVGAAINGVRAAGKAVVSAVAGAGAGAGAAAGGAAASGASGATPDAPSSSPPKKQGFFGRMFSKAKSAVKAVGSGIAKGASAVGGAVVSGAKAVGGAVASGAKAVYGAGKSAVQFVGKTAKAAAELAKNPKGFMSKVVAPKAGKVLGTLAKKIPIIGSGIEALMAGADIMAIKNNPEMTVKEKKQAIGERVGSALGGIVGAAGGGVIGSFIPVPILGSILGAVLGDMAGRYVGGAVAGAIGGEKIYDALSFMLPDVGDPEHEQNAAAAEAQAMGAEGPSAGTGVGSASPRTGSSRSAQAAQSKAKMRAKQDLATKLGMDPNSMDAIGGMSAEITSVEGEGKNAVYKAEAKIRGKPTGLPPRTQAQADYIGAGSAENRGMETAMASAGATEVSNAVQSNSAVTNNQFMGGSLRSRNTHDTLERVAQDRQAYGFA